MDIILYKYEIHITRWGTSGSIRTEDIFNVVADIFRPIGILVKTVTSYGGYTVTGVTFEFRSRKITTLKWTLEVMKEELSRLNHISDIVIQTFKIEPETTLFTPEQIDEIEAGFNPYIVANKVLT